ncbi:hypothetical protein NDU88_005960 [Pleurodeles waltl]|uniref:Reverse transcriptase zinc-binding domain-containing protein n=1 Tax=Pleurodeles waltl TaxID=8319 RepID=A0AAV7RPW9_PLEWA|nr:hypothetical protein NDU88_005960 [Pleurodeles waltl]
MSNIYFYYLATHLLVINDLLGGGWTDPAYRLELQTICYSGVFDALYGGRIPRDTPEVMKVVLLGWRAAQRVTGWWDRLTRQTPLWQWRHLREVSALEVFWKWDNIGISTLGDVWGESHMRSFEEIQESYSLNKTQFPKYLQLRHTLLVHIRPGDSVPNCSPMEARTMMGGQGRRGISQLYRSLLFNTTPSHENLRRKWEGWVGPIEEADWRDVLMAPRTMSMTSRFRVLQTLYLHTAYLTPERLFKTGLRQTADCPRCSSPDADFFHMVWACPVIMTYWKAIVGEVSKVLHSEVEMVPFPLLLGAMGEMGLRRADRIFLGEVCLVAKRDIMIEWKAEAAPTLTMWRRGVDLCALCEKSVYEARGCPNKYNKIWG